MSPVSVTQKRARLLAALRAQASPPGRANNSPAITDLAVHAVREPVSRLEYVLAVVSTDAGITGVGEAAAVPDASTAAAGLLEQKKSLVGRSATAVEALQATAGRAAINMALLDITGKLAKAPIYEVLGGPTRFKARAATAIQGDSIDAARAAGFRAIFVPLAPPAFRNQGQAFVRGTRRRLDRLRAAGGDEIDFVLDCNGALTPGDAQMLAHELESFHLLWLDEPCSPLNLNAVARIAGESVTPIGLGRRATRNSQFQDLLRLDAVDILRPNMGLLGITQIRKAAALAEAYYVAVAPYHRGGPVASAACLQLAASIPNFFLQEVPFPAADQDRRMRAELVSPAIESPRDGFLPLPAGPGLGITLNLDAVRKYQI